MIHKPQCSHAAVGALLSTSTGIDKLALMASRDTMFCTFRNLCKDDMEEIEDRILYSQVFVLTNQLNDSTVFVHV